VESPLVRGGLTIGAGIVTGNIIGFVRVALTAYLLGTHSQADSLAVAVGPLDALNSVLINTMVFAFVPMLTARQGADRTALFLKLNQWFAWLFSLLTLAIVVSAPWLIAVLAPGLDPRYYHTSVTSCASRRSPSWRPARRPSTAPCYIRTGDSRLSLSIKLV
jgi:peptidoglycan biosynthesis protein MviN/MurJ (putative lipid II flippase)